MTYMCASLPTLIVSDNSAIIWTNGGIMYIGPLGTNLSEILIGIYSFHSVKFIWKSRLENGSQFISASMC